MAATFPSYRSYTTRQLRQFTWLIAFVIVALVAYGLYRAHQGNPGAAWSEDQLTSASLWIGGAAAAVGLGRARPELLRPPLHLWMTVGTAIGLVMNAILLSAFFLAVLTPIGLVMRALGRTPLRSSRARGQASYWLARDEPDEDHYPRPFGLARARPVEPADGPRS